MNILLWIVLGFVGLGFGVAIWYYVEQHTLTIPEDKNVVMMNRHGFITRVLPSGVHYRLFSREKICFDFDIKPNFVSGRSSDVLSCEGVNVAVHWAAILPAIHICCPTRMQPG